MVVLPEGKMSSRVGNVITFSTLRERLHAELLNHMKDSEESWPKEELNFSGITGEEILLIMDPGK